MAASNRKLGAFFLLRLNDHVQYMNKIKATLAGTGTFRGCDHHSCKLGRWIDGDGRKQAEALGPEILALFDSLHAPHVAYHAASKAALDLLAEGTPRAPPGPPARWCSSPCRSSPGCWRWTSGPVAPEAPHAPRHAAARWGMTRAPAPG